MTTILELNTGLFPDAHTVAQSIQTRQGHDQVIHLDVSNLKADDTHSWNGAAAAILKADLIVTL